MSLGDSYFTTAIPVSGGLYDYGYNRNKFAKRFNEKTKELHNGSSRPKVTRRRVKSLPFMVGL